MNAPVAHQKRREGKGSVYAKGRRFAQAQAQAHARFGTPGDGGRRPTADALATSVASATGDERSAAHNSTCIVEQVIEACEDKATAQGRCRHDKDNPVVLLRAQMFLLLNGGSEELN
jgi:hypothetical protein